MRQLLLEGDFFLGTTLAGTLTKLSLRYAGLDGPSTSEKNSLTAGLLKEPDQRCDFVYSSFPRTAGKALQLESCAVVLDVAGTTTSDHYGVLAALRLTSGAFEDAAEGGRAEGGGAGGAASGSQPRSTTMDHVKTFARSF